MRTPLHARHIQSPAHVQPTFRAPAHKHAHHLHSIPPREKSTRTLIIDHLLWVHARTRLAQARAELGMTDPSGGPSSPSFLHRRRPENYDEDEHALSDGEDLLHLKSRRRWNTYDDDALSHRQDLPLAQCLRLRAEGLESVINSMLDQPPPHHPAEADIDPPRPPKILTGTHPHILPNGVRLRLALGTVINDLFARQHPPQPYRHTHPPQEPHSHHSSHHSDLPEALVPLLPLSGASAPSTAHHTHPRPAPSPSTLSHYTSGADPSTANSPPSLRCPRHLHTGCPICVEAKPVSRPTHNHHHHHHRHTPSPNNNTAWRQQPSNLSGWQDGTGIGSGLLRPGIRGNALRRRVYDDANNNNNNRNSPPGGNTKLSRLLPRFLKLSALVAVELGQEARDEVEEGEGEDAADWQKVFNAPSRSRPTRVSPSKGKQRDEEENRDVLLLSNALRPTREWYMLLAGLLTRAVLEGYLSAGWRGTKPVECLLLVGIQGESGRLLGARARRIEGGVSGVAGQGRVDRIDDDADDDDREESEAGGDEEEFRELDPDGLPSLRQALRVLFPSLRNEEASLRSFHSSTLPQQQPPTLMTTRLGQAEAEYELEMYNRLRHFYDIPESTPDLSTHLEDLAWSYPAEPVERAAVRFCEAIARWRGKPELETYKKKPSSTTVNSTSPTFAHHFQQQYSLNSLAQMMRQQQQQQQRQPGTTASPALSASSSSSSTVHPLHPSYHPYLSSYQQQPQQSQQQQQQYSVGEAVERRRGGYRRPLIDIYFSAARAVEGYAGAGVPAMTAMNTNTTMTGTNAGVGMGMGLGMMGGVGAGMNVNVNMNNAGVRMGGGVKRSREDEVDDGGGGGGMVKRFHHM